MESDTGCYSTFWKLLLCESEKLDNIIYLSCQHILHPGPGISVDVLIAAWYCLTDRLALSAFFFKSHCITDALLLIVALLFCRSNLLATREHTMYDSAAHEAPILIVWQSGTLPRCQLYNMSGLLLASLFSVYNMYVGVVV